MAESITSLVMGIDGGGTRTTCLVATANGHVVGQGEGGPANPYAVGLPVVRASLHDAITQALAGGGYLSPERVGAITAGLAGVHGAVEAHSIEDILRELLPSSIVRVCHDADIVLAAGTGGGAGVAVIAGTGSIALGRDGRGRAVRSGGWGYIIGDEGSGYAMMRSALARASAAIDGRAEPTLLVDALFGSFNVRSFDELLGPIYGPPPISRQDLAAYAPLVVECAERRDSAALTILQECAADLASLVKSIVGRLHLDEQAVNDPFPVACNGSVFRAGPLLIAPLIERVARISRRAHVCTPLLQAAAGAVVLAIDDLSQRSPHPEASDSGPDRRDVLRHLATTHAYPAIEGLPAAHYLIH